MPVDAPINYTVTLIDDKGLSAAVPIVAVPIVTSGDIYINGTGGNDTNAGTSPAQAVKTFAGALGKVANNQTIWITNTISITDPTNIETWSLDTKTGVTVKRYGGDSGSNPAFTGTLVQVESGKNLSLDNITIDGQGTVASGGGVNAQSAMITVNGGTVTLNRNAILQNNKNQNLNGGGVNLDNGTLIINGEEISNNSAKESGGGVYLGINSTLNLENGRTINISENTASNMSYDNNNQPKIYVIGNLHRGTTIGLDPSVSNARKMVVQKSSSYFRLINPTDFFLDSTVSPSRPTGLPGRKLFLNSTGHLIITP